MIEVGQDVLSVRRQCELLGLSRRGLYYRPVGESAENLQLMGIIDETYTQRPFYGVRKMTAHLRRAGHAVNPKRVRRLKLAPRQKKLPLWLRLKCRAGLCLRF